MKDSLVILSIDLGSTCGISVNADGEYLHKEEYKMGLLHEFDWKLKDLYLTYKPNLILIPYPVRFYNTTLLHGKYMGIVCLLAEKRGITVIEVNDATCKKTVIRNGEKGKTVKKDIMEFFNEESEHIADSMMFCEWYLKSV